MISIHLFGDAQQPKIQYGINHPSTKYIVSPLMGLGLEVYLLVPEVIVRILKGL